MTDNKCEKLLKLLLSTNFREEISLKEIEECRFFQENITQNKSNKMVIEIHHIHSEGPYMGYGGP